MSSVSQAHNEHGSSPALTNLDTLGKKYILPSSWTGGTRHMCGLLHEAQAFRRRFLHKRFVLTTVDMPKAHQSQP
jgi:hypothetical protein